MALKAGTAHIVITPPVGLELAGWGFGPSVGVLDDLEAQALVLSDESTTLAIVTTDLIGLGVDLVQAVRQRIETSLGIPAQHVLLSASHTHSGPAAAFYRHWGDIDESYARMLESHLAGLVAMAQRNLQVASIGAGSGRVEGAGVNRRTAGGVFDPAVPVIRIDGTNGQPLAVLWNYACHPVSLHSYRNLISPDYPGYARSVIRSVLGPEVTVMFTLGAGGDVNPTIFRWQDGSPRRSWEMGALLGCEVVKTALGIAPRPDAVMRSGQQMIDLPVEPLPPESELTAIRDKASARTMELQQQGRPWDEVAVAMVDRDWAVEALQARATGQLQRSRRCEIQAFRLADAALVALPLEVFTETGLDIKGDSPAGLTIVSSNSNGTLGYLPTAAAYQDEDYTNPQGSAPKVYDLYAFSPGAEPTVRKASTDLVAMLFN